jgi:hypothetical protein
MGTVLENGVGHVPIGRNKYEVHLSSLRLVLEYMYEAWAANKGGDTKSDYTKSCENFKFQLFCENILILILM